MPDKYYYPFDQILTTVTELTHSQPLFQAACVVGSYAKESADRFSDGDLICFVEDGRAQEASALFKPIINKYDVIYHWQQCDPSGHYVVDKFLLENFSSLELVFIESSMDFRLRKPYIKLFERGDFLERKTVDGDSPRAKDYAPFEDGVEGLTWELHGLLVASLRGQKEHISRYLVQAGKLLEKHPEALNMQEPPLPTEPLE